MKGQATFLSVDHRPEAHISGVSVDSSHVVRAIRELTEAVKAVRPEIRVDLPAMSPTIQASPVPVHVTVPELPPNPPVSVTVPDFPSFPEFPRIPEYPVIKVPSLVVAAICFSIIASNVCAVVAVDLVRSFFRF